MIKHLQSIFVVSINIDVLDMLKEVLLQPENWFVDTYRQKNIEVQKETESINLVKGVLASNQKPSIRAMQSSHLYQKTDLYKKYPAIVSWLNKKFPQGLSRIAIIKLPPGGKVYPHTDFGEYYRARNRYHLVLSGEYNYFVNDEVLHARPGMLFWFNNDLIHYSQNISREDRIAVVFDVEKTLDKCM